MNRRGLCKVYEAAMPFWFMGGLAATLVLMVARARPFAEIVGGVWATGILVGLLVEIVTGLKDLRRGDV